MSEFSAPGSRAERREKPMKKGKGAKAGVSIRREYDFTGGVRGKYADRYPATNIIILDPDLAERFPTSESVNRALRKILATRRPGPRRA
jgi:hypothetical protein